MAVAVSVVVIAQDFRSELDQLFESLDRQSLPTEAFEVVVVDTGSTDGTLERLRTLSGRRPNITVVEASAADSVRPDVPLEHCVGEYVITLQPGQVLFPEALERMHAEAAQKDLDALSGRVSAPGLAVPDLWTADDSQVDPASVPAALAGPAVLMRRALVAIAADPQSDSLPDSTRVGVLSGYPALLQPARETADGAGGSALQAAEPVLAWSQGLLRLEVGGTVSSDVDLGSARPLAVIRETASGLSFVLGAGEPLGAADDGAAATRAWSLVLDVDLRKLSHGGELPPGMWEIDIQLVGAGDAAVAPVTLPWTKVPSAVLGTLMVVPAAVTRPTWRVDAGPTTWPLVGTPDPANATVTESATGSLLVLTLPDLYVSDSAVIEGELGLESLRLPAKLITDGTSARVEAYVSGLQGNPRIGTQFGPVAYRQTGLRLEISNIGTMVVARVPQPAAKPAAAAPSATPPVKKPVAKKAAPGKAKKPAAKPLTRVQHLRQALPKQLDPVAEKVAKNPLARRVYRRIAKL